MPVLVRNTHTGPLVFTDKTTDTAIEWAAAGDPAGEHIQQVPDKIVENINFLRVVNKGLLVVEEASDEAKAALENQAAAWQSRQDAATRDAAATIDNTKNNDIIAVPCIGPSPNGRGECGKDVNIRELNRSDRPPLCGLHESLSSQFILTETDKMDSDGKAIRTWQRMGVGAREQASIQ